MYKHVIVKTPGKSYVNGLTTSDLGTPNYEKVLQQHASYVEALKNMWGVSHTLAGKRGVSRFNIR
ncbi:N-dimethylarginine dimethylaminohydrolase [Peribacillus sp. B2I2]